MYILRFFLRRGRKIITRYTKFKLQPILVLDNDQIHVPSGGWWNLFFVNGGQHFQSTCKRIFIIKKTGNYLLRDMCSMDKCGNRPDKKKNFVILHLYCLQKLWIVYVCVYTIDNHQLEDSPHKCMQIQDVDFSIMFIECMGHDQAFHSCSEGYNPDL